MTTAALTEALDAVKNNLRDCRDRIASLKRRLTAAQHAPFPPDDLAVALRRQLEIWLERQQREIGALVPLAISRYPPSVPAARHEVLCFLLLRDVLLDAIPAFVGRLNYRPGPPVADRRRLVDELETELAAAEREEEQLVDDLQARGFNVEHRHEVVQRRAREQSQREQEHDAAGRRAEREAAIEARFAQEHVRTRGGPSQYLASDGETV